MFSDEAALLAVNMTMNDYFCEDNFCRGFVKRAPDLTLFDMGENIFGEPLGGGQILLIPCNF